MTEKDPTYWPPTTWHTHGHDVMVLGPVSGHMYRTVALCTEARIAMVLVGALEELAAIHRSTPLVLSPRAKMLLGLAGMDGK